MAYLAGALVFLSTLFLVRLPFLPSGDKETILRRLQSAETAEAGAPEEDVPFRERILLPLTQAVGRKILRLTPKRQLDQLRGRLQRAGDAMTPAQFVILRLVLAGVGILPVVLGGKALLIAFALGVLGYRMPEFWLSKAIAKRQKAFGRLLPDTLDLLAVSVEAGMGFDQALQRVAERARSPIREEISHTLSEIRVGRTRAEALSDLAARMDIPELRQFVSAVVQAEALGVGMARPLRVQADTLRVKRRQKAEEMAMKTPIKLLFPLVFLVFPSLFIILLGPAVLTFMKVLHP